MFHGIFHCGEIRIGFKPKISVSYEGLVGRLRKSFGTDKTRTLGNVHLHIGSILSIVKLELGVPSVMCAIDIENMRCTFYGKLHRIGSDSVGLVSLNIGKGHLEIIAFWPFYLSGKAMLKDLLLKLLISKIGKDMFFLQGTKKNFDNTDPGLLVFLFGKFCKKLRL